MSPLNPFQADAPAFAPGPPTVMLEGAVARIQLNRPGQHNRFEAGDVAAFAALLEELERDRRVRVLVITATGPSFSAGFDIGGFGTDGGVALTGAFAALCDRLESLRMPTVCALNGNVYGGATDFALACDIRLGSPGLQMMVPPTRLGIEYYYSGLRRYVERLGLPAASRLFLTGEPIDAETMLRIGFLAELVAPEALRARADAIAAACAARAPGAVRGLKASLNAIARGAGDPAAIQARFDGSLRSAEAREGLLAWSQKRGPVFADD